MACAVEKADKTRTAAFYLAPARALWPHGQFTDSAEKPPCFRGVASAQGIRSPMTAELERTFLPVHHPTHRAWSTHTAGRYRRCCHAHTRRRPRALDRVFRRHAGLSGAAPGIRRPRCPRHAPEPVHRVRSRVPHRPIQHAVDASQGPSSNFASLSHRPAPVPRGLVCLTLAATPGAVATAHQTRAPRLARVRATDVHRIGSL